MKKQTTIFILVALIMIYSCKKTESTQKQDNIVTSPEVLAKIRNLGFSDHKVYKIDSGYLVENDIILHEKDLDKIVQGSMVRIAQVEQYRTNVVITNNLPRTLDVYVSAELPTFYRTAADIAIARYNALNLLINFRRVTSPLSANMHIWNWDDPVTGVWASSSFPNSPNGPYPLILMNAGLIGPTPAQNFLASVIAHEMGHCIGFRHTDYLDRSFSCLGPFDPEPVAPVGAVHIPGTPTTADAASWILACIGRDVDRPFNANDIIALQFVY